MPFAATITLTLNSVAKVLNRINQDSYGSEYSMKSSTESIVMQIRHSVDSADAQGVKMDRHNIFVTHIIYATPLALEQKYTATGTFRMNSQGDPAKCGYLAAGLTDWLDTAGVITDLVAGVN